MTEWRIDSETLALFVFVHRETKLGLSIRQAQHTSGISASTISRVENRQKVSAANFAALCLWIGANPFWFLIDPRTGKRVAEPPEVRSASRGTSTETVGKGSRIRRGEA